MIVAGYLLLVGMILVVVLSLALLIGWSRIKIVSADSKKNETVVTVLIAARNEELTIGDCLQSISRQDFPAELLEVIVVDDSSEDGTQKAVHSFAEKNNFPVKLIDLKKEGKYSKKQAIEEGVRQAKGELIVTTDADCTMRKQWLKTIVSYYEQERPDFISGPVAFHSESTLFEKLQSLEFIGLVGSGASFLGLGIPVMCNGANLAYPKKVFLENGGFSRHGHIASGDDTYLMSEIAAKGGKISFLKSMEATVFTSPLNGIQGFMNQRIRWASKSFRAPKIPVLAIAAGVFFINVLVIGGLVLSFFDHDLILPYLFFIFLKCLSDGIIFFLFAGFFKKRQLLFLLLPAQYFFACYSVIVALASPFTNYKWKGRKTR